MPVIVPEENPTTGTGVYYPACGPHALFAYHGIMGKVDEEDYNPRLVYGPQELIATENAFRTIWEQGAVYSNAERQRLGIGDQRSMFFGMDRAAGDDEYVFLNICKPHDAGKWGYHLVFDPYRLIEEGALVGFDDLQGLYMSVADGLRIEDRNDERTWTPEQLQAFQEDARFIQNVWRIKGGEAEDWLEWIQGARESSPVNAAALRYVDREVGGGGHRNIIRWLSTNKVSAIGYAEIVMPRVLSLDWLIGVIFRKNWIRIDDFVEYYGPPGTEPPEALNFHFAHWVSERTGHPARCVRCGGWMYLAPLELPESTSSWGPRVYHDRMKVPGFDYPIRVMECKSCGAAFAVPPGYKKGPFEIEEFVGEFEDLEHEPYRW